MLTAAHTVLAWLVSQILWLVLLLSVFDRPGPGGVWGALMAAAIIVPPLVVPIAVYRWRLSSRKAESVLASRAITTQSGFQMVPATGLTPDDAIICLERNPSAIPAAEVEFLRGHLAAASVEVIKQALRQHQGRMIDVLTVTVDGSQREVYFDVSRSALFSG